ncbi:MAG: 3-dehydroquinate synthase [Clostridia bacterium]|nr:3-dehydroquinate synthase [Clostridia bacterium]
MEQLTVNASRVYDIFIGHGVRDLLSEKLSALFGKVKVCLVCDSNVAPLHAKEALSALEANGFSVENYIFPAGEQSKSPDTLFSLLEFLAEKQFSRKDVLVALGGGVTGDLTGLASALFMRGMHLVQMPTSLLAMVDSSVGGKTAVNLKAGKNLAGVFCQPELVLCDLDYLSTLPQKDFADGMAEVIKYGVIADSALFDLVKDGDVQKNLEEIVTACVRIKRDVVAQDEFDTGERAKLNFGHTLAHAIEKKSGFAVSHGAAVAMGMVAVCAIADANGLSDALTLPAVKAAVEANGLSVTSPFSLPTLYEASIGDKKRSGNTLTLVLPNEIGRCYLKTVSLDAWKELLATWT